MVAVSPPFISLRNIQNLLTEGAPLGMAALGQTFVILTAGLDLSVGSLMSTVAVIATSIKPDDAMIVPIFLVCILFGAMVGFINGWLVTKRKVSPFLFLTRTVGLSQLRRSLLNYGASSMRWGPLMVKLNFSPKVTWMVVASSVATILLRPRLRVGRPLRVMVWV